MQNNVAVLRASSRWQCPASECEPGEKYEREEVTWGCGGVVVVLLSTSTLNHLVLGCVLQTAEPGPAPLASLRVRQVGRGIGLCTLEFEQDGGNLTAHMWHHTTTYTTHLPSLPCVWVHGRDPRMDADILTRMVLTISAKSSFCTLPDPAIDRTC